VVSLGLSEVLASLLKPSEMDRSIAFNSFIFWPDSKPEIVNEAAFILSNITAGNDRHIQSVVNSGCFDHLVKVSLLS